MLASSSPCTLTTLDGEAAKGYVDISQVERAMHLSPQSAAPWLLRLTAPLDKLLLPCMPWVVLSRGCCRNFARQLTSPSEQRKSCCGTSARRSTSSLSATPSFATGGSSQGRTPPYPHAPLPQSLRGPTEPGKCTTLTAHTPGHCASRVGPRGYVCCPFGTTLTELGSLASASQSVPLAHSYNQTQLCNSVH